MNCVAHVAKWVEQDAWTHHIPRLMVLANLATLAELTPQNDAVDVGIVYRQCRMGDGTERDRYGHVRRWWPDEHEAVCVGWQLHLKDDGFLWWLQL